MYHFNFVMVGDGSSLPAGPWGDLAIHFNGHAAGLKPKLFDHPIQGGRCGKVFQCSEFAVDLEYECHPNQPNRTP